MLKRFSAILLFSLPILAHSAVSLDDSLQCNVPAKDFFAPLIQQSLISPKPSQVSIESLNFFKPKLFKKLTAFGMPVTFVIGFINDQVMFIHRGSASKNNLYGVIVNETISNVQAQLSSYQDFKAKTFRVNSALTMIICSED